MRIAIVDNEAAECRQLSGRVEQILAQRRLKGEVCCFRDGESFLAAARKEPFFLVFLDIYMEGMDGMTAARTLRSFDAKCLVVFTTTSTDHALEGFRVRALHYLVKPYSGEELETVFDEAAQLAPPEEKEICLRVDRQEVQVRLGDIVWAENYQHRVLIHGHGTATMATRMTFGAFTDLLKEEDRFFVCGRGVLVNLDYAQDFDGTMFLLDGGVRLPVSRDLAGEARRAFGQRLFRRERGAER